MRGLLGQVACSLWALWNPSSLRPTYIVPSLSELVIPPSAKLVILDKDNTFAKPHEVVVWPSLKKYWDLLVANHNAAVLSNTSGDSAADPQGKLALELENSLHVPVIRHRSKKPACHLEIREKIIRQGIDPKNVLIVGDRLLTDVLLANLIGSQSAWIRPGIHPGWINKIECLLYDIFTR